MGVLHPSLWRNGWRGDPRLLVAGRAAAALRQDRRGRDGRRLRPGAVALGRSQRAVRRIARTAARVRLRLLPPGPRGGAQGGDRGLPGDSPSLARPGQRPRDLDRGAHAGGGEVGRPHPERRSRGGRLEGACSPRRGRGGGHEGTGRDQGASERGAHQADGARDRPRSRQARAGRSPSRCAGSRRSPTGAGPDGPRPGRRARGARPPWTAPTASGRCPRAGGVWKAAPPA